MKIQVTLNYLNELYTLNFFILLSFKLNHIHKHHTPFHNWDWEQILKLVSFKQTVDTLKLKVRIDIETSKILIFFSSFIYNYTVY